MMAHIRPVRNSPLDRLEEEWPRISYQKAPSAMDPLREGVMREEDLFRFLKANLLEEDEEDDNVREAIRMLLKRIGGEAASVATKTEVLEFLASLQGCGFRQRPATAKSQKAQEGQETSVSAVVKNISQPSNICESKRCAKNRGAL